MRYRALGASGLQVSVVGLGCNNFGGRLDRDGTAAVIDAALDAGITLFDTADIYGGGGASETLLGELLGSRRQSVVLATKFGHHAYDLGYGPAAGARGSRSYLRRAVQGSLRRLRTDYLDLYQLHTPDPHTPLAETVGAMQDLVREGLVRYLGHSNLAGWQIADVAHLARGGPAFVSAQNHYSLLERDAETEVLPACAAFGVGVLPYFPLANGLLTGKVGRDGVVPADSRLAARHGYVTADKLQRVAALADVAASHGRQLLDYAVAGLLAEPTVGSVIAGAMTPAQVQANAATADVELSAAERVAIDAACPPRHPVPA